MIGRGGALALWTIAAALLIGLLVAVLGLNAQDVATTVSATPAWAFGAVLALTALNKIVGAWKWRAAAAWLSPGASTPTTLVSAALNALGALFGQILPIQIANAAARWLYVRRRESAAGWAISSTVYEQVFDLVALLAAGACGVAAIALGAGALAASALGIAAFAALLLIGPRIMALAAAAAGAAARLAPGRLRGAAFFAMLEEAFARAAAAPPEVARRLFALSALRVVIVIARALLPIAALAPSIELTTVAAGAPAIGLIAALPTTPGGVGVVEWTWSGVLILAGSAAAAAAALAITLRILNFVALAIVFAGYFALAAGEAGLRRRA